MKYALSLAALGAALVMSGCVVPVGRYPDGYRGGGYDDGRGDCVDRQHCDRHDRDRDHDRNGERRDDHGRP